MRTLSDTSQLKEENRRLAAEVASLKEKLADTVRSFNVRLEQSLAHKRFRYKALSFMLRHPSIDSLTSFLAENILELFDCDRVSIAGSDGPCRTWTRVGLDLPDCQCHRRCPLCPLCPNVADETPILCIADVRRHPDWTFPNECPAKSVISFLVRDGGRPWRRLTILYTQVHHKADEHERHTLESAANILSAALEHQRLVTAQDAEAALRIRALDKAPISVYIKDADDDFRYVFVNDFTLSQLGRRREEMLGRTDFDIMPHGIAEGYRRNDMEAMSFDESISRQETYFDSSGTERLVQSVRCSAVGADGHRLVVGYSLELTELMEKQRRIEALQRTAERERDHAIAAEQAKVEFFASVSHDIRTPLNTIIGFSELLKNETDPAVRQEYLDCITFSGNTLLLLVNDVLDLARLDAENLAFSHEPLDLGRQIHLLLRTIEATAREKNLELRAEIGPLPIIVLDEHRIRQILFNLIGNAIKYTDSGGVTVSAVFERSDSDRGTLRIAVRDTGIGIAPEDISRLMRPYVRLQGVNARGGTGLGLAICKRIVEGLGGTIAISSEPGSGSVFAVMLPNVRCLADASAAGAPSTATEGPSSGRRFSSLRVLVVDDMEMNRRVIVAGCRRLGVGHADEASSSAEALDRLRRSTFDLVLTDMKMPGMDGREFVRAVRADGELRRIPVFLVTADVEARNYYRKIGADGVLLKPIVQAHLAEVLSGVCMNGKEDGAPCPQQANG